MIFSAEPKYILQLWNGKFEIVFINHKLNISGFQIFVAKISAKNATTTRFEEISSFNSYTTRVSTYKLYFWENPWFLASPPYVFTNARQHLKHIICVVNKSEYHQNLVILSLKKYLLALKMLKILCKKLWVLKKLE